MKILRSKSTQLRGGTVLVSGPRNSAGKDPLVGRQGRGLEEGKGRREGGGQGLYFSSLSRCGTDG